MFSASLEPHVIAERVGVRASNARRQGDLIRPGGPSVLNHQWVWRPDAQIPWDLDSQLDAIAAMAADRVEAFEGLKNEAEVVLSVVIEHLGRGLTLGWSLDRRHLELAAALGASLDIDEYDYTEP